MRSLLAIYALLVATGTASAQKTVCDSPCKEILLPLVTRAAGPVSITNPLKELQGAVQGANLSYFEYQVDKPARRVPGTAVPQYPDSLKAAKIEGEVVVAFTVDTAGIVVPGSVHILKSTHAMFTAAVRDAISNLRFTPAELNGVKVRQMVQAPYVFNIAR